MKNIVLLDGGVGQEIYKRAGKPATPMWSAQVMMDNPEVVKDVHQDFIKAGASIITMNSYTCTPTRLKRDGQVQLFETLQLQALDIASRAREELGVSAEHVSIAGCLPPLIGSYTVDERTFSELKSEYEQIVAIQAPHVDLFLIETISNVKEAKAAVEAARHGGKPVWLSFTLSDDNPNQLRSGETIDEALHSLKKYPLGALLFNCSFPETIGQGLLSITHLDMPYGGYANGFTSVDPLQPGGTADQLSARTDLDEKKYASHIMDWIQTGATVIGGCCEVGPSYIDYIFQQLQSENYTIVSRP
ncbi:MAG: homocysteine S-methyltransferase family protein [Candidatus Marinimicrobia bacterium]|nr:homocysteine S-methyltransferase family protein [Candidatus Neomarinimicrobiota bacterium]MCF7880194.1 homocysteine S-methyltransferase family protein [Candidatus Neomarinimicrobiota bacterium]